MTKARREGIKRRPPATANSDSCRACHLSAHQIGHQRRQAIVLPLQPVVLDRHVLPFDVAGFVDGIG